MTNKQWVEKNRDRLKKYQADYYLKPVYMYMTGAPCYV